MLKMGIIEVEGAANKPPVVGGWVLGVGENTALWEVCRFRELC